MKLTTRVAVYFTAVALLTLIAGPATAQVTRFDAATDWANAPRLFKPYYQRAGRTATLDDRGVTVATSPGNGKGGPHGVRAELRIDGDIQVEVTFDLIDFPFTPLVGGDYGLTAGVNLDAGPTLGAVRTARSVYQKWPPSYHAEVKVPTGGEKNHYASSRTPTLAKQGRLGIRRVGREAVFLAAETPDGPLFEWTRYPFTDQPVRVLDLYADTGGASAGVTARLYDLQVRAGTELPPAPPVSPRRVDVIKPMPATTPPPLAAQSPAPSAEAAPTATSPPPATNVVGKRWLSVVGGLVAVTVGVVAVRRWRTPASRG